METTLFDMTPKLIVLTNSNEDFLLKLKHVIEDNISIAEFSVENLASALNISTRLLSNRTGMLLNASPSDLISDMRLTRAKQLLIQNELNISEVAFMCGFADPKYFSRWFKKNTKKSPSQFIEC